jgi:hypothetical protein
MRVIWLLIFVVITQGCEKIYFKNEPDNSPVTNFEIFTKDFDRNYSQFVIRQINWDSISNIYRLKINLNSSNQDLFNVFNEMIQLLKDGHVNLYSPIGVASYNNLFPTNYRGNQLINANKYISFSSLYNSAIESGTVNSYNIGYIQVNTFYSSEFGNADPRYNLIDNILQQNKDKDGIIIDVRGNGGGNGDNALTIASRFADKRRLYYKQKYKNGPGKNDFSDWVNFYLDPQGEVQFTKPVVVLMSRCTFSAAEIFVSAMRVFPNVTLVGDTTTGGIGNPVYRELPNGWSYRLSTSIGALADGSIIDGKGIVPDVTIIPLKTDTTTDIMLEKAIGVIMK